MIVAKVVIKGLMRMAECSILVLVLWLIVALAALPMAAVLEDTIRSDVGASRIHEDLRTGLDLSWLEEFHHRGEGLAETLQPVRVSSAMVFANLELWLDGSWMSENRSLAAAALLFLMIWILLQGGVIAHLSSTDPGFRWGAFLTSCGRYFLRFLRLGLLMGVAYYGVYKLAYWLFPAIDDWTKDVTVERTVLIFHLGALCLVVGMMATVHLVADFAKIATVKEGRRSMVLAVLRSVRQVARHPLQSYGLLSVMFLMLALVQVTYAWIAPGVGGASPLALVLAFGAGQLYLLTRWALRIARFGAEIELYSRWTEALSVPDEPDVP